MRKLKNSTFSSPIKVLVVEDEPGNVEFISEMLRKVKNTIFELVPARRVSKGLERLTAGDIDAVLLGFSIKDDDVLSMFRRFNKQAPDLPVLVLSDRGNKVLAVEAVRAGAED
jgi:DNA-binding NtrC family response regulator